MLHACIRTFDAIDTVKTFLGKVSFVSSNLVVKYGLYTHQTISWSHLYDHTTRSAKLTCWISRVEVWYHLNLATKQIKQ